MPTPYRVARKRKVWVRAVVATLVDWSVVVVFTWRMVPEVVQPFWAALQRGEFITDAAECSRLSCAATARVSSSATASRSCSGSRSTSAFFFSVASVASIARIYRRLYGHRTTQATADRLRGLAYVPVPLLQGGRITALGTTPTSTPASTRSSCPAPSATGRCDWRSRRDRSPSQHQYRSSRTSPLPTCSVAPTPVSERTSRPPIAAWSVGVGPGGLTGAADARGGVRAETFEVRARKRPRSEYSR